MVNKGFCEKCPNSSNAVNDNGDNRPFGLFPDGVVVSSSYDCGVRAWKVPPGSDDYARIMMGAKQCKASLSEQEPIIKPAGIISRLAAIIKGCKKVEIDCLAERYYEGIKVSDLPANHGEAWDMLKSTGDCQGVGGRSCDAVDRLTCNQLPSLQGTPHQERLAEVAKLCASKTCINCPMRAWAQAAKQVE